MINPQMMGQMGQMPNIPSVKELWKNEKTKYRHWIILLGIGLLVILALLLAASIMNWADVGTYSAVKITSGPDAGQFTLAGNGVKYELAKIIASDLPAKATVGDLSNLVDRSYTTSYIIWPIITLVFIAVGIILYADSLLKSYKAKSFAKLSSWPTMVVGIAALMAIFSFFGFGSSISFKDQFNFAGGIFTFVANLLFIIIYFVASAPVSKLRRIFLMSERIEKIKEMQQSPQFQQMQQQMMQGQGSMGAFGPMGNMMGGAQAQPQQGVAPQQGQTVTPAQPEVDPERKKLEGMKKDELVAVAKELSISGYSTMDKKELIEAILRVTENN